MLGERKLYIEMRGLFISTLEVHRVLTQLGFTFSKRTLQNYLDSDMLTCPDTRVVTVVREVISSRKNLITNLKELI